MIGRRMVANAVAAVTAVVAVAPVLLLLLNSVASQWFWPSLSPRQWSGRAWSFVLSDASGTVRAAMLSFVIAAAVTVLAVAVALPAARALASYRFPGRTACLFAMLLPVLAPPLASAMGMHSVFLRLGWTDSVVGVIAVHLVPAIAYATMVLMGAFLRFDRAYEAQARTLGASAAAVWLHVTIPAIRPGLTVAACFAFLISWSQYLLTLLIGGGRVVTVPLELVAYQRAGDESVTAALSIVFLAPALAVFLLASNDAEDHV